MSGLAPGAAVSIVISERIWNELGQPRAMRLLASTMVGVSPDGEALASVAATQRLANMRNDFDVRAVQSIETSETSAAQIIAFARQFGLDPTAINTDGGAIARGHPFGAAGAVLVTRLFSTLVRQRIVKAGATGDGPLGLATLSAIGGLGAAALFLGV